jgi:amino acid transporter
VSRLIQAKKGFGTLAVFLTAISTILGAIMFLRFGYAVGSVSFYGTMLIIIIGHIVTIPTSLAIAEIATNQKVEGGGEYFIISRSFGINIGAAIGIALYFARAISVSFYIIAFAEAFDPVFNFLNQEFGWSISEKRIISIPFTIILIWIMLRFGANIGMKALYVVVAILFVSLVMFFMGDTGYSDGKIYNLFNNSIDNPDSFFYVFAIIFPAFTGITAGVGLSGDLKNPKKSIPIGTLAATISGMIIYVFIALKMVGSASPEDLVADQLIMSKIAIWGPIIPIGLAAATFSSALGSIMVAPRILQALAQDQVFQVHAINSFLRRRSSAMHGEPFNATLVTSVIAIFFVIIGDVNFVAEIISMFFMVTYGSICMISFLQHFAGDPSYRPAFKSKGFVSLIGAIACVYLMFEMNMPYAIVSMVIMTLFYIIISSQDQQNQGLAKIFQGVIFQISRRMQIYLQKAEKEADDWRPSVICISETFFKRPSAFNLLRWISHKYGFGTYMHFIQGYLSKDVIESTRKEFEEILTMSSTTKSNVYIDTMISPSYTSAIAQAVQMPSISGKEFNMILFEYHREDQEAIDRIVDNIALVKAANFDVCILGTTERDFGFRKRIDIWITRGDFENSNLMILMGYIIMGHPEWRKAIINIFAIFPEERVENEKENLVELTSEGRLPISAKNIEVIEKKPEVSNKDIINQKSKNSDLTIIGMRSEAIKQKGTEIFEGYNTIGNILFFNASKSKKIT